MGSEKKYLIICLKASITAERKVNTQSCTAITVTIKMAKLLCKFKAVLVKSNVTRLQVFVDLLVSTCKNDPMSITSVPSDPKQKKVFRITECLRTRLHVVSKGKCSIKVICITVRIRKSRLPLSSRKRMKTVEVDWIWMNFARL